MEVNKKIEIVRAINVQLGLDMIPMDITTVLKVTPQEYYINPEYKYDIILALTDLIMKQQFPQLLEGSEKYTKTHLRIRIEVSALFVNLMLDRPGHDFHSAISDKKTLLVSRSGQDGYIVLGKNDMEERDALKEPITLDGDQILWEIVFNK